MTPVPGWDRIVRLRATSAGSDPETLVPGRDLALEAPRRHGELLPHGVLLDDLLSAEARDEIDREAIDRLAAWRSRCEAVLTIDGVSLPHVWETELLAEVFLPETRIVSGLLAAFTDGGPRRTEWQDPDAERASCLAAVLAPLRIGLSELGEAVPPPSYPSVLASSRRPSLRYRAVSRALRTVGVPQWVRGTVYLFPYWHLGPVFERLGSSDELRPVLDPSRLPPGPLKALLRNAARGGWVGHANANERRLSRRLVARALSSAAAQAEQPDPLDRLLQTRALRMLEQRAGDTLAAVKRIRAGLGVERVRLALLPFDSPPEARVVVQAARDAEVPTVVVQHGFGTPEPNEPDKSLADTVAVWSDWDVEHSAGRVPGTVVLTGNPGVTQLARPASKSRKAGPSGRTLVLVEYASRISVRVDNRIACRHVGAALAALARARPRTLVTIRPHPSDHEPEIFAELASRYPALEVRVDAASSIEDLIGAADLCIGAISTASLQAAVAGAPVILLNMTGRPAPWPFDGSGDVPVASSADELAEAIPEALAATSVRGQEQLARALGVDPDAVDRVVDLIGRLAAKPSQNGAH